MRAAEAHDCGGECVRGHEYHEAGPANEAGLLHHKVGGMCDRPRQVITAPARLAGNFVTGA